MRFTEEQEELRAVVRRFLAEKSPSSAVRHWMESDTGYDQALWCQLSEQLGLTGLAIPEEYGGAGGGPVELAIVFEEMGRVLTPSPYFATVGLAAQALTACGDEAARSAWLPKIADGSLTATLAVAEESGIWQPDGIATLAVAGPDGWELTGTKMFVIDGAAADLVLVVARVADGLGVFAVPGDAVGLVRTRLATLDPTRRLARIELHRVVAQRVDTGTDGDSAVRRILDLAVVALAAEQVGGAQACLDAAVDYAKIRVQFDRPIGSFQAIKHKCADLLLAVEAARSMGALAAETAESGTDTLGLATALAGASCAAGYTQAAKDNVQIHGGIGYTWEHDAHLHLKRAKSSELLFGGPVRHRARVAELAGI
nr:acyl-CoA dehydrogenase family protein [Nocardia sp. XZ_19_231]